MFTLQDTVGGIVAACPSLSRIFEELGIDFCCGGKFSLEQACARKGVDPVAVVERLNVTRSQPPSVDGFGAAHMSLTELSEHIVLTHHGYLKSELPRLEATANKVATVHGGEDPRLFEVHQVVMTLANELHGHMMKEEQILFPMIGLLESGHGGTGHYCGTIRNPIRQMEHEHDHTGGALAALRELTEGHVPPDWACNTYRVLLDTLSRVETDLHMHIHKENNILFPRAIELEDRRLR
ncbi:MAG: iron-sulfur cluster repair di-iron protein [Candidatus Hydrogenedentes bacterium]|nr:iron-sulfur cluster repair di-iron protein [Candidatus Hydrogenedentota bacterium]